MTFRTRLVLLNSAVLAGLLTAFAAGLATTNSRGLRQELVHDLRKRGDDAARNPNRPGPPRPPRDFEGEGPDPYAEARNLADVRRPRFFNPQGEGDLSLDPSNLHAALTTGEPTIAETNGFLVYSVPLPEGGAVQVVRETADLDRLAEAQRNAMIVFLPLGVLVAAAGAWLLAQSALRPVRRIATAAADLGAADLSRRLPTEGDDELASLARTLNAMLTRLERSFEEQRRFVADASHELRTPLARLRLAAASARERKPDDEDLASVERAAIALSELSQSLLTLAKSDATGLGLRLEPIDLRVVVAEALDDAPVVAQFPDAPVSVLADAPSLGRAVKNLVENALRHTSPPGQVFVTVTSKGGVVVRDEGEGIDALHLPHLFERFYRVDAARASGGTGLGLALVKEIVEAHSGAVNLTSEPGSGTTVRISLSLIG